MIGFSVTPIAPKAPNTHANYRSKVLLTLPFRDPPPGYAWHALWAGPGLVDNYHTRRDTHYAIDISPRAIVPCAMVSGARKPRLAQPRSELPLTMFGEFNLRTY